MKKLAVMILLAFIACSVSAQSLVDIYKNGNVKLIPDKEFAKGNDWNKVFASYKDSLYGKAVGLRKSLKITPVGSIVVNNAYRNFYTKFSADGKFEKEFGITDSNGKRFKKKEDIAGIINNNFFSGLDNMGNMICFDMEGRYSKTLKLDYMTRQMIPLPNNKIAVVGWVIWKEKFRDFVAIVDYETNEEKVIWEHFTDRCAGTQHCNMFNYSFEYGKQGSYGITTMPFSKSTGVESPVIASVGAKLIIAIPKTGEILQFDLDGNLQSKDKIEWASNTISVEEQKEIQKKAIEKFKALKPKFAIGDYAEKNTKGFEKALLEMETDLKQITKPIPTPVFSTVIKDSDNNLLFFEFPKEKGANKFNVWIYKSNGSFVGSSSFECDDYNLQINPSKMVFYKGYIYALQELKEASDIPLRLVRFRVTN
ncbi:hypothetical protein [Labilibaculum antarcticum]|uniref:6-bladed beta-propeller n=1 Tax=Labilibaculum antarcticum TaxID=1717717 RepID=A0A1Y1CMK7_9BACT|nr:hypothetical protein [Labilibaculum antarcticum]BAX81646.1 hypothetical protein ALGA_3348 [Labilibaculum antarcticum]